MTMDLASYLNARDVDASTLVEALEGSLASFTQGKTIEKMRAELIETTGDRAYVDRLTTELENHPAELEMAALAVLPQVWAQSEHRPMVERAIEAAESKLAVLELSILALVSMYSAYLIATGGIEEVEEELAKQPDGRWTIVKRRIKMHNPGSPFKALIDLVKGGRS